MSIIYTYIIKIDNDSFTDCVKAENTIKADTEIKNKYPRAENIECIEYEDID